jgi:hypothetical protein
MLLVKTRLDRSQISGIGLYADEFIPKGTIIWRFTPGLDLKLNQQQLQDYKSRVDVARLEDFIYRSKISGDFILCADDARFINHSAHPNTIDTSEDVEGLTIASRDIFPGEEIVSDYESFDADFDKYKHLMKDVELMPTGGNGVSPKRRTKLR